MLCAGASAITKMDVAPVLAIACVGLMRMAFALCRPEVVQLEVTTVILLSPPILLCDGRHT
jgi:hypothetical protein